MGSCTVQVYPYHPHLQTALYGKERPAWRLPEPFTEKVQPAVWKFLLFKKLAESINEQMRPCFCSVELDDPEVRLSPLPGFMRQPGLTESRVDEWKSTSRQAFCHLLCQFAAFECAVDAPAWKVVEKDVRSVVREDAVLLMNASKEMLTVAGQADNIQQFKAPVEALISKAMSQVRRQRDGVSEGIDLAPAVFCILQQEGLQKVAQDISLEMKLSYDGEAHRLALTGLPAEVFQMKAWILERNSCISKKVIDVPPGVLDFLKTVDSMDMSEDLFISQGTKAVYSVENKGVLLLASSDQVLADAERKMKMVLAQQIVDVEDPEVLQLQNWMKLKQQLMDIYNSLKKKTVEIQIQPARTDRVMVTGFLNPVKEVSCTLKEFIFNYSKVQETIRVDSCAVVQFLIKKRTMDWSRIADTNNVIIHMDEERPKVFITGPRLQVQKAKSLFQELLTSLHTDNLIVDKPGAKKYFQSQGGMFLSSMMMELNCVVVLGSEDHEEEEDKDEENSPSLCKFKTVGGVLVSVSKANICSLRVDAVVNAANEDLQHTGGVALALLNAAGKELQEISNRYISKHGRLKTGQAIATDACDLPCKHVIHAVGPRFSDNDSKTSVSLLKRAVKQSLEQAEKLNCSTIALPAISSGVFGFPVGLCASTIAEAVREYCDNPGRLGCLTEVHLVDTSDTTVTSLAAAVNDLFSDLGPTMTAAPQSRRKGSGASG